MFFDSEAKDGEEVPLFCAKDELIVTDHYLPTVSTQELKFKVHVVVGLLSEDGPKQWLIGAHSKDHTIQTLDFVATVWYDRHMNAHEYQHNALPALDAFAHSLHSHG